MRPSRLLIKLMLLGHIAIAVADTRSLQDIALHPRHSASATALSLNDATLSAQLQAPVKAVHVRVSESVSKGALLVTLDCADYKLALQRSQAQIKAAEARLALARSQRQRSEQLVEKELTSREAADTAIAEAIAREAELQQARLDRQRAALDVSRCTVRAPYAGIVTARPIAEGQLASVGSPLVQVVETDRIELSARLDPADIPLLQRSGELYFDFGRQLPVKVHHLGGVIDSSTRNQEVRFIFPGDKPPPGAAGKLVWRDPRLFVPSRYIVKRDQTYGVFVARDGVAAFVPLPDATPGRASPTDLSPETLVVVEGLGNLQAGDAL